MPSLLAHLARLGFAPLLPAEMIDTLSAGKGAYLLLIRLAAPLPLAISTLPPARLMPGDYVYCGSARGAGGIRARLRRHFSTNKRCHWHVDHLTLAASHLWASAVPDGDECQLAASLLSSGRFSIPVDGFGASDCRRCAAHLLAWTPPGEQSPAPSQTQS